MKSRHIKLNILVSLLLLVILAITFALFFSCAITGLNEYAKVSYNKFQESTKDSSEGIFVVDIEQQAAMAQEIFYTAGNMAKLVADYVFTNQIKNVNKNRNIDLKYNKKYKFYSSLKHGVKAGKNKNKIDELIICWSEKMIQNKAQVNKYLELFSAAGPMLQKLCKENYMCTSVWVAKPDEIMMFVSDDVETLYKIFEKNEYSQMRSVFDSPQNEDGKCSYTKVYLNENNEYIITVMYPRYEKGKIIGVAGINLRFTDILNVLYGGALTKYYEEYKVVRLFLDDEGYLVFYPREYIKLLSLPDKNASMLLEKECLYDVNLNSSKSKAIRNLAKKMIINDSGKETVRLNGKEYLVSFKALPVNNWKMALMICKDDLYKDLYELDDTLGHIKTEIYTIFTVVFIIIAVICLIVSVFIFNKQLVKPIEEFCKKIKLLGKGDFSIKLKEKGIQEIFDLSKSFNSLGFELNDYIKKFEKEVSNRKSVEKEINLARRIQENVIPHLGSSFNKESFSINARLEPAKNVSGDFYDVFYINDNKIAFIVADVSGKGFPAAFFMAIARTAIRNICLLHPETPAEVFTQANKTLCENNKTSMFVTAFLGFYEVDSGRISYCNAGHLPPILYSEENNKLSEFETVCDPPLGCIDDFAFTNFEKQLNINEILILFTDGVIEAENDEKELYGNKRLKEFIVQNIELSGEEFLAQLFETLFKYQNNKIADDITVFFLKRRK